MNGRAKWVDYVEGGVTVRRHPLCPPAQVMSFKSDSERERTRRHRALGKALGKDFTISHFYRQLWNPLILLSLAVLISFCIWCLILIKTLANREAVWLLYDGKNMHGPGEGYQANFFNARLCENKKIWNGTSSQGASSSIFMTGRMRNIFMAACSERRCI